MCDLYFYAAIIELIPYVCMGFYFMYKKRKRKQLRKIHGQSLISMKDFKNAIK